MKLASWFSRQLARCPLACPALAVIAGVALADQFSWWSLALFVGAIIVAFGSRKGVWVLALLLGLLAGGLHFVRLSEQQEVTERYGDWWSGEATVVGKVKYGKVFLSLKESPNREIKCQAWFGRKVPDFKTGDTVRIEGRIIAPREPLNPDVFPEREWLHRQGVSSVVIVKRFEVLEGNQSFWTLKPKVEVLRSWVKRGILRGLDAESSNAKIICAMVLGELPNDSDELLGEFRDSGTIHVFAVSGLHVMMVGSLVGGVLILCGCGRKVWVPLVILSMFFYALLTGLRPPAMRAAIMGAVLLGAWLVHRRIELSNSVALGVIVSLLWNSHMLFLIGFQLSFVVLVAIVLLGRVLSKVFSWVGYMDPFMPRSLYSSWQNVSLWIRRKIEGGLVVASAAWCGVSPLTFRYFGLVSPISILLSVPMVLLLYLILLSSAISLVLGGIHAPLGKLVNRWNSGLAGGAYHVAALGASIPGGHYRSAPWQEGERVVVYAMPEGEAAVYLGLGGGALLDVGSESGFRREVLPSLIKKGAKLDSLLLSHADSQHCGGVEELLGHFSIKQAMVPKVTGRSSVYTRGLEALIENDVAILTSGKGGMLELSESAFIEILYAPTELGGLADDRCSVFRLHWKGRRVLFLNDAGYQFERWVESHSIDVSADVLVVGKHSRDYSSGIDFIKAVQPKLVIAPKEMDGVLGWSDSVKALGCELFVLNETGSVSFTRREGSLIAKGFVKGELKL